MAVSFGSRSEQGPRALNQDYFFCDGELGLFVVADGMGGHRAGEVASRLAVEALVDFVKATRGAGEITWPFPFDPKQSFAGNRLSAGVRLANRKVYDQGRSAAQLTGMGTTIVAALVEGDRIAIGHVGDSRAYRLRNNRLDQLTRDHTWVAAMLEAEPNARTEDHPMRHVLTSGIGMRDDVTPAIGEYDIASGDCWLLCSDGVHGYVDQNAMASALQLPAPDRAAQRIVTSAIGGGGTDNATAVVLRFV